MAQSRAVQILLASLGLLILYVAGVGVRGKYGIRVSVRNNSRETLRNLSAKVEYKGIRYPMPDLAPGHRATVFAQPVGESHINVEFTDAKSVKHTVQVEAYVETGYCGSSTATIGENGAISADEPIPDLVCWKSWLGFLF